MPRTRSGPAAPPYHRSGEGSPLVLLHGLTGTWRIWRPVIPLLEPHHDVIAPTLLGHAGGAAYASGGEISVKSLADDVERVLDEVGVDRPHVAGNSLGGWLSLELAARGRPASVIAFSPAGGWTTEAQLARVSKLILQGFKAANVAPESVLRILRRPRARLWGFRSTMAHGDRVPAAAAFELLDDLVSCSALEPILEATLRDGPFDGDLQDVTFPIRVAWGELDRTIPFQDYGEPLLKHVPTAELLELPGVGHVPMYDDPQLVAQTILDVTGAVDRAATVASTGP
ncbi:alpha/beta hydrolase [Patulibacter sp. NPDC049589]|uniref:alpha/beta fold hydrolase n=1 Tax=Patulibacter sp. NPDC049589 TaxID=3154731 RepID=UPI00341B98E0